MWYNTTEPLASLAKGKAAVVKISFPEQITALFRQGKSVKFAPKGTMIFGAIKAFTVKNGK